MTTPSWAGQLVDEDFPERLAAVRRERGYTYTELSRRSGVSDDTISNWERRDRTPASDSLRAVAEALDVTPGFLGWGRPDVLPLDAEDQIVQAVRALLALPRLVERLEALIEKAETTVD